MKDVVTSRRFIFEALQEAGMISFDEHEGDSCLIHPGASHDVETCSTAEELLQGMMDQGWFEIGVASKGEQHVCMQSADKSPSKPKPLVIHFTRDAASQKPRGSQPIPGKKFVPFPCRSNKAVPWRYAPQKPNEKKDEIVEDDLSFAKVTNICGMSGVTRSGRVFEAPNPLVRSKDAKGKAKVGTKESDEASSILNEEIPVERFVQKDGDFGGKKISTEEENEFLRIIQQSEFKVIEQLNKTPARVPCWNYS